MPNWRNRRLTEADEAFVAEVEQKLAAPADSSTQPLDTDEVRTLFDRFMSARVQSDPASFDRAWLLAAQLADAIPALLAALAEVQRERDELRKLTAVCSCYDGNPQNYEGPHADCPLHGAIRAYNEASADLAAALEQRDDAVAMFNERVRWGNDLRAHAERMRPVLEAAKALRKAGQGTGLVGPWNRALEALAAAVDTYETQESTE